MLDKARLALGPEADGWADREVLDYALSILVVTFEEPEAAMAKRREMGDALRRIASELDAR